MWSVVPGICLNWEPERTKEKDKVFKEQRDPPRVREPNKHSQVQELAHRRFQNSVWKCRRRVKQMIRRPAAEARRSQ